MSTYRRADAPLTARVRELIDRHHPDLKEAGVKVGVLMAFAPQDNEGQPRGHALTSAGWPAAAKVRVVSHKDRVAGLPDAQILIDGDTWQNRSDEEQEALLRHECTHLEVRRDEDGAIVLDDCNRPKLKMRLHDIQFGIFTSIAREYRGSIDAKHLIEAAVVHRQLDLPFAEVKLAEAV